jgi:hypothetical protein
MKKWLRLTIIVIFFLGATYLGYRYLYLPSIVKLPPPQNPPAFGVTYLYNFPAINLFEATTINQKIEDDLTNIKEAGFEAIKINFHFRQDNTLADSLTAKAALKGLYPVGELVGHDEKPKDRAFTAEELAAWENFVRDEVRKNKNLIYYWEVWNEPCMTELFRYGTPAEYLEFLKQTQEIIKEESPSAKVIVTADYTDTEAENFTNEFLGLGGADYFDYLSFHPYNALDAKGKFSLTETLAQEKELAEKYNKPLWITEIGLPDSDSSESHQAEIALTLFRAAYENKISLIWFYWSDQRISSVDGKTGWGLVRTDGSFKPAYEAIKSFISSTK